MHAWGIIMIPCIMTPVTCNIDFPNTALHRRSYTGVGFTEDGTRLNSFFTENVSRPGQTNNIDCIVAFFDSICAGRAVLF